MSINQGIIAQEGAQEGAPDTQETIPDTRARVTTNPGIRAQQFKNTINTFNPKRLFCILLYGDQVEVETRSKAYLIHKHGEQIRHAPKVLITPYPNFP